MKRVAYGLALLLLCSGVAAAQSQTSSPGLASAQPTGGATPDTDTSPPNVADHPGADGASAAAKDAPATPLPGVTVTKRNKACAKNDPSCYEQVSAEIWRKYPEQIATLCKNERIRVMRQGFQQVELGAAPYEANTRLTPQTEALCDYGPAHGLGAK